MPFSSFYEEVKKTLKYEIKGAEVNEGKLLAKAKIEGIEKEKRNIEVMEIILPIPKVKVNCIKAQRKVVISKNICSFPARLSLESSLFKVPNIYMNEKLPMLKTEVVSISTLKKDIEVIELDLDTNSLVRTHYILPISIPRVNKEDKVIFSTRVLKEELRWRPGITDATILARYIPLTRRPLPLYTLSREKIRRAILSVIKRYALSSRKLKFIGVYDGIPLDHVEKFRLFESNSLRVYLKVKPILPTRFMKIVVLKDELQGSIYLEPYED